MAAAVRPAHSYQGTTCPRCGWLLDHAGLVSGPQRCAGCGGGFEAVRFDPPGRHVSVAAVGASTVGGETPCANHAGNAATSNCDRCGIFMCSLCRIDADEIALCPACFERLSAEGALASTRTTFRDYARQASTLALLGVVMWVFAVAIGPAAVYLGFRALREIRARGETEGRARAWIAIAVGGVEAGLGALLLYMMFRTS